MLDVAFDLDLEHGRCVGMRLPEGEAEVQAMADALLRPEERAFAATLGPVRRRTWVGGRGAMRAALNRAGLQAPPLLPDDRGAPTLPPGLAGSISHKEHLAVALLARESQARIGIDIEQDSPPRLDIASKVLADDELPEVAALDPAQKPSQVLLRFSMKEAVYKALDPFVRRYVGFKEVSVSPRPAGGADVRPRLRPGEGPFVIEVRWRVLDGAFLTTATVSPCGTS